MYYAQRIMIAASRNIALVASCSPRRACAATTLSGGTLLLLATLLSGCADTYVGARAYIVQGKFDYMDCKQLAAQHKTASTRIEELERLQSRAEREAGGLVVSSIAYGPTITDARAERRIVEETQAEKKCGETDKKSNP